MIVVVDQADLGADDTFVWMLLEFSEAFFKSLRKIVIV